MHSISAQSIVDEYHISLQELQKLLQTNTSIEYQTKITAYDFDKIKKQLNVYKYSAFDDDLEKTAAYSETNLDVTIVYADNENATAVYVDEFDDNTSAYNSNTSSSLNVVKTLNHNLGIGDIVVLKDIKYKILEIISEGTGEAVIYKIENSFKNIFVLKLYFEFVDEKQEPNSETLERIKTNPNKNILKLFDYGVGFEKYKDNYCFEISEFAEGGDLLDVTNFKQKYTPDFIETIIIPKIFEGIKHLHSQKIYHCDLKPGNIFYLDEAQNNLIIGDYGSAKAYDIQETKEVIKTATVKGSNFYLAPEQARGLVSDKNDYYSFGMILLHLFYPEKFTVKGNFKKIDNLLFEQIVERGDSSMKLIDFNPDFERINKLIEGLTLNVRKNRWGEKEVEKWIANQDDYLEIKYLNKANSLNLRLKNNVIVTSEEQLITFVEQHSYWQLEKAKEDELWYNQILNDNATLVELQRFLDIEYSRDFRDSFTKTTKSIEQNINSELTYNVKQQEQIDYSQEALIRLLLPAKSIQITKDKIIDLEDGLINKKMIHLINELDEVWQKLSLEKIRFILFQLEFSLKVLLKKADGQLYILLQALLTKLYAGLLINTSNFEDLKSEVIIAINSTEIEESQAKLLNLFDDFKENRSFYYKNDICETLEELGLFSIISESEFENTHFKAEKKWFLKKKKKEVLTNLDHRDFVFEILKDKVESTIEFIGLHFDKKRIYNIKYQYYKSLTNYLSEYNITKEYILTSETNGDFTIKRKRFATFGSIANKFIKATKTKHNIVAISTSNEKSLERKIVWASVKRYSIVYWRQILTFIAILLFALAVLKVIPYVENYSNSSEQEFIQPSKNATSVNRYGYIKANPAGNVRSGTSTKTKVVAVLYKGEKIYIVEKDNASGWYKIKFGEDKYGYVSRVIVSFDFVSKNK